MSLPQDYKEVYLNAHKITIDNRNDEVNSHINIFTTGNVGENDLYLKNCNVKVEEGGLQVDKIQSLDGTVMLDFNATNNTIDFNGKNIQNFNLPNSIATSSIASTNYPSNDLEYELDLIHTNINGKASQSGWNANKVITTTGGGILSASINTADIALKTDLTDFITDASLNSTLSNYALSSSLNFYTTTSTFNDLSNNTTTSINSLTTNINNVVVDVSDLSFNIHTRVNEANQDITDVSTNTTASINTLTTSINDVVVDVSDLSYNIHTRVNEANQDITDVSTNTTASIHSVTTSINDVVADVSDLSFNIHARVNEANQDITDVSTNTTTSINTLTTDINDVSTNLQTLQTDFNDLSQNVYVNNYVDTTTTQTINGAKTIQNNIIIDQDSNGEIQFSQSYGLPSTAKITKLVAVPHNTNTTPVSISLPQLKAGTSSDQLVSLDAIQTLTSKTLTNPSISSIINGSATLTLPSSTGTLALTSDIGSAGLSASDDIDFTGAITFSSAPTVSSNTLLKSGDNISLLNNNSNFITNTANAFSYSNLSGTPTIPSNNNQLSNGAGYITRTLGSNFGQSDFTFSAYGVPNISIVTAPSMILRNQGTSGGGFFGMYNDGGTTPNLCINDSGEIGLGTDTFLDTVRNPKGIHIVNSNGISFLPHTGVSNSRSWRLRNDDTGDWGSLGFSVSSSNSTAPGTSDTVMTLTRDKKVGIGATAPADYLTVRHGSSSGSTYRGIAFEENDGTLRWRVALTGADGGGDCYSLFYSNTGSNTIMFHATSTSFFTNGLKVGASGSSSYDFEVVGTAFCSTSWSSSDDRIKHNETAVENAIETIKKLEVKKYFKSEKIYDRNHHYPLDGSGNPITDDKYVEECGIIAQQIKTIPELAFCVNGEEEIEETVKNLKEYELDGSGNPILDEEGNPITYEETVTKQTPLGVNYTNLFCYNIKAVQELINKVELLEQQLQALQS